MSAISGVTRLVYHPFWTMDKYDNADTLRCMGTLYFLNPDIVEPLIDLCDYGQESGHDLVVKYTVDNRNKTKRFKKCIFGVGSFYLGVAIASYGYGAIIQTPSQPFVPVPTQSINFIVGMPMDAADITEYVITTDG